MSSDQDTSLGASHSVCGQKKIALVDLRPSVPTKGIQPGSVSVDTKEKVQNATSDALVTKVKPNARVDLATQDVSVAVSGSSVGPLENGATRESVSKLMRTLLFRLPRDSGLYIREHFTTMLDAMGISLKVVEAIGPLSRSTDWHLTLRAGCEDMLKRLLMEHVKVKGRVPKVSCVIKSLVRVRVHWLPYFIPQDWIHKQLAPFGTIDTGTHENSITSGITHSKSLIQSVVMEVRDLNTLPHTLAVPFLGQFYPALVTVPGRPPICLKCKQVGHVRRDCAVDVCRHCNPFGHTSEACAVRHSYAGVVRSRNEEERVADGMAEDTVDPGEVAMEEMNSVQGAEGKSKEVVADVWRKLAVGVKSLEPLQQYGGDGKEEKKSDGMDSFDEEEIEKLLITDKDRENEVEERKEGVDEDDEVEMSGIDTGNDGSDEETSEDSAHTLVIDEESGEGDMNHSDELNRHEGEKQDLDNQGEKL